MAQDHAEDGVQRIAPVSYNQTFTITIADRCETMNNQLVPFQPFEMTGDKNTVSRLRRYQDWMEHTGRQWWQVDLASYRDFLLRVGGNDGNGLSPNSVVAHLSTIRGMYQRALRDKAFKRSLYQMASAQSGPEASPADIKAIVDEIRLSIMDAIHPSAALVTVIMDIDPDAIRLTVGQANKLLRSFKLLRDRAAVALCLATGIREAELCAVEVEDLRARMDDGALALRVKCGKGAIARKVPYGDMINALDIVRRWMNQEGIAEGRVFPFTTRTFQRVLHAHPLEIDGELVFVRAHDLRRTYARRLFEAGVPLAAIQQNLGHSDPGTTMLYVGELNSTLRQPPALFDFTDDDGMA